MVNAALNRLQPAEAVEAQEQDDMVLVHVRFHPNSEISAIGEKPAALSERAWFKHLLDVASPHYQVFAGGRGFFRIPRPQFEDILKSLPG